MRRSEFKCCVGVLLIVVISFGLLSCNKKKGEAPAAAPILQSKYIKLEKAQFAPGDNINITFNVPESARESGWIGIIPSRIEHGSEKINDDHDIVFHLLKNSKPTDTYTFPAPEMAGEYDIRINDSDSDGKEIDSISFKVVLPATTTPAPK